MSSQVRKRHAYDASFKLKVVAYAIEHKNNSKAARAFYVSEKQVRDWRKSVSQIAEMPQTKKACRGLVTPHEADERLLRDWVLEQRQNDFVVTRNTIRIQAQKIFNSINFKASAGWCTNFMNRHGLFLQEQSKISQKLPAQLEHKIVQFHSSVIKLRKTYSYNLSNLANMDETTLYFDLPGNRTVHPTGDRTLTIRRTGHENNYFNTVLCACADGTKLKPMLIFKSKTVPKEKFPKGVVMHFNETGWMDDDAVYLWFQKVWAFRPSSLAHRSMLIWDSFHAHMMENVKNQATHIYDTDLSVIPERLTSVLQPLDVSLKKPFKDHFFRQLRLWLANEQAAGSFKKPSLRKIAKWVVAAWNAVDSEIVKYSFKKCGISNALDGTEDDILWEEPSDQIPMDSEDDEDVPDEDLMTDQHVQVQPMFGESK